MGRLSSARALGAPPPLLYRLGDASSPHHWRSISVAEGTAYRHLLTWRQDPSLFLFAVPYGASPPSFHDFFSALHSSSPHWPAALSLPFHLTPAPTMRMVGADVRRSLAACNFPILFYCFTQIAKQWNEYISFHQTESRFFSLQAAIDNLNHDTSSPLTLELVARLKTQWQEKKTTEREIASSLTELKQSVILQAIALSGVSRAAAKVEDAPKELHQLKSASEWLCALAYDELACSGMLMQKMHLLSWMQKAFIWQLLALQLKLPLVLIGGHEAGIVSCAMGAIAEINRYSVAGLVSNFEVAAQRIMLLCGSGIEKVEAWRHRLLQLSHRGRLANTILATYQLQALAFSLLAEIATTVALIAPEQLIAIATLPPETALLFPPYFHRGNQWLFTGAASLHLQIA